MQYLETVWLFRLVIQNTHMKHQHAEQGAFLSEAIASVEDRDPPEISHPSEALMPKSGMKVYPPVHLESMLRVFS